MPSKYVITGTIPYVESINYILNILPFDLLPPYLGTPVF